MKNTEKNCIKLAADVTDSMDMDDLLDFVRFSLVRQYLKNKDFLITIGTICTEKTADGPHLCTA